MSSDEPYVPEASEEEALASIGHPRGTLAVLGVYMGLFILGWVFLYYFLFLPRGAPQL